MLEACGVVQVGPQVTVPRSANIRHIAPAKAKRLYDIMVRLLRAMNNPLHPDQVHVGIVDDAEINAANAGAGNFYLTTGLLEKANDRQLRGIMAHEIAHVGHVAELQLLGAGLSIGAYILEQLLPGSALVTPIAGTLIARGYTRREESEPDHHALEISGRAGYSPETLDALRWLPAHPKKGWGWRFSGSHRRLAKSPLGTARTIPDCARYPRADLQPIDMRARASRSA